MVLETPEESKKRKRQAEKDAKKAAKKAKKQKAESGSAVDISNAVESESAGGSGKEVKNGGKTWRVALRVVRMFHRFSLFCDCFAIVLRLFLGD